MQGIENLKEKLNEDIYTAVSVESLDGFEKPYTNFTKSDIIKNFGSIDTFFEDLKKDYPDYRISERRQNGTVIKGNRTKVNYKTIKVVFPPEVQEQTKPTYVVPNNQGLNNPNFGLGMTDLISLNVDKVEKHRLEVENEFLKKENEELKKLRDEYKEYKLSTEYSDKKSEQTNGLLTAFLNTPVAEKLAEGLAGFMAKNPTGLNAPGPIPEQQQDRFIQEYSLLPENEKNLFKNILYLSKYKTGFFDKIADIVETESQQTTEAQ